VTCSAEDLLELRTICPGAEPMTDGPLHLVYLPSLRVLSDGKEHAVDGLLCLTTHKGYVTRLYLSRSFQQKQANWRVEQLVGRAWHSWSWQGVPALHRPAAILAQHLRALR